MNCFLFYFITTLSQIYTFPIPEDSEPGTAEQTFFASLIETLITSGINEIRNDENLAEKIKFLLGRVLELASKAEYAEYPLIPVAIRFLRSFSDGELCIRPETALSIIKSVVYQATKEPDTLGHNVTKIRNRLLKTVGDGISNVGSVTSGVIGLVKDLHETQASYTNHYTHWIPGLGPLVRLTNTGISTVFQGLHLGTKVAMKDTGRKLTNYANTKKMELKEQRRVAKSQKKMQGNSKNETNDIDMLDTSDEDEEEKLVPKKKTRSTEQEAAEKELDVK